MYESEELSRLADLHQRGALSDDEFARAKARVLGGQGGSAPAGSGPCVGTAINTLQRSRSDRWFGGVCGGLGRATGMAPWLWRLGFTLLLLCGGTGLLVYLLLWIFVPLQA
ncbi:MAG: PspC domain-containing protein [Burkholderiaceae bacterium]